MATTSSDKPRKDGIAESTGMGFMIGFFGGSAYHFVKGFKSAASGTRFLNGTQAMRMNALRVGGELSVFCGTVTALEKTLSLVRQKEDPWNHIIAGTAAAGLCNMRYGLVAASKSALFFGATIALSQWAVIRIKTMEEQARMAEKQMKAATLES